VRKGREGRYILRGCFFGILYLCANKQKLICWQREIFSRALLTSPLNYVFTCRKPKQN